MLLVLLSIRIIPVLLRLIFLSTAQCTGDFFSFLLDSCILLCMIRLAVQGYFCCCFVPLDLFFGFLRFSNLLCLLGGCTFCFGGSLGDLAAADHVFRYLQTPFMVVGG
ncbi:Uncharacterized protein TCM_024810 [Theobroma cacao]|uniref:Uncharacterized protein n=1 Tax=Theobroma cacao TaxID=3641 RepID=A0A061EWA7_THECC|nr:Uncharacterized protein TCM_024810 [Theobroma cacao]